ncbi:MAG: DUF4058 family protein [Gemmataceae bacterium]|nr:DUF4058 family protein [Gemmataceae bacterium]
MPLRDHFRPPVSKRSSWEGFHGCWPGVIVQELVDHLPDRYVAEPRVHLGQFYEIDICAFEQYDVSEPNPGDRREANGGVATAIQAPPAPTLTIDAEFPEQYAYEVLIFDLERERQLVAAVEIVSPANKDRPESRQLFVAKCYNLLQKDVCVSIIDLVTIRQFNLYTELLALLNGSDPAFSPPPPIYAVTCRKRQPGRRSKLDTWSRPLAIGEPLPSLPIWLSETQTVTLDLEASYEETCRVLRVP